MTEEIKNTGTDPGINPEALKPEKSPTEGEKGTEKAPEKTYTEKDVNQIVNKRLARERAKFQELLNGGTYTNELDEREKNIRTRELKLDTRERLANDGLPADLLELMNFSDEETLEKSYQTCQKVYQQAVAFGVKDALKSPAPRKSSGSVTGGDKMRAAFGLK